MSTLEEHRLTVSPAQTRPTSSHTIDSGILTDTGSTNSGLRRVNSMVGKQIRSKLLPDDKDPEHPPRFLPLGDLESIMCEGAVDEIIADALQLTKTDAIEIKKKICGKRSEPRRIRILATLILIEKVKHIRRFLDHNVWDDNLPLFPDFSEAVFQGWKPGHVESFCHRQYVVLAPIFDFTTMEHNKFGLNHRMPFLERLVWECRGAHGTISKVRIHKDHQFWDPNSAPKHDRTCFAIKKFQDPIKFEQERQALERFSLPNKGHDHLVRLLLSYERGDEFFMIFPWAQGNLAEFWKKNPSNPASRHDSSWFLQQCLGLAGGLRKVHNDNSWLLRHGSNGDASQSDFRNQGRHGDIKPENILFFPETETARGRLVVADFTLMRFHSMDTVNHTEAGKVGFSETYYPPEVDTGPGTIVSQKYDIWTLGCVYLEFITWYLIGYDAIREDYFTDPEGKRLESFTLLRSKNDKKHGVPTNRFFTQADGSGAKVKDSVKEWIRMLHAIRHCSEAMDDFLDLVEEHMLVAVPDGRWPMDRVCTELAKILERCEDNDVYWHWEKSRPIHSDDNFPPEFNEQSTQYSRVSKTTYSASTSSLDSRLKPDLNVIEGVFADVISTRHPPQPSRLGDQPTSEVKSKAGQHLLPPDTWYPSKRTAPSNHSLRSDSSRSLDPNDISPGDSQLSPDADPQTPQITPATSCRPDSSDEAFFRTTDKEKVVDPEDQDEVDLPNAEVTARQ
ncbi:Protein kinase domain-containing protein [Fusarium falciforme]|uniref:Protein kinase domain-containing protein n=1 Tax=Fusarium falciforme TaxID=195108 RepID=UPI0023012139|nr:Protein kinase domain-containing protein [Fusarium falciforme]WAO87251.1 Protein kinase domain-containing protein [Fusarium falciforme]